MVHVSLFLLCGLVQPSTATTFYVRTGGSDSDDGLTPTTSLATIAHAAALMQNPGDQVVVGPGTYREGNIEPARSGFEGHPMEFLADTTGLVTGDPAGPVVIMPPGGVFSTGFIALGKHDLVYDGFTISGAFDAGIQILPANRASGGMSSANVIIRNTQVLDSVKRGIDITAAGTVMLEGNTASGYGSTGIAIAAGNDAGVMLTVSNNQLGNNGSGGIFVNGAVGGSIEQNQITCHGETGIRVESSSNLSIVGNVINGGADDGIGIGIGLRNGTHALCPSCSKPGSNFVLTDNVIEETARAGINMIVSGGDVQAIHNTVTHSGSTALSVQSQGDPITATISNNTLGISGAHGLVLVGLSSGLVQNNVSFSNAGTGIMLRSAADVLLANNLVYANGSDGVAIGTADRSSPNPRVINNTVYQNGRWGLRIGSAHGASSNPVVLDNIFQRNRLGGIAIARNSRPCYVSGFNINPDGYGPNTPSSAHDMALDPLFVNPAGADGVLGGDGFADDDFHLAPHSPGINAGVAAVADVGITGTTAEGSAADVGTVDIGYHYGASPDQRIKVPTPYMPLYVRVAGNDGNDGLDPQRALASIREAARRARTGGTVVVGPGRYHEGDIHPFQWGGPVTFFADSTGMATGDLPGPVLVDAANFAHGFVLLNSCVPVVDGFDVTGSMAAGIQVRAGATASKVRNNVVFSNQRSGIEVLQGDAADIRNNLVYANGTGGIRVAESRNSTVANNTVYGNGVDSILIGGTADFEASPGTSVLRNIVAANGKGIKVPPNSFAGYVTQFNIVPDGFAANTPRGDSDFIADPLFVNPAGADGILGGDGFLDDDFHLRQGSPAVDVDFGTMNALATGSTRSDGLPDLGPLDAGYHYPFVPLAAVPNSVPQVVFVRNAGNDTNQGTSAGTALASIREALDTISGSGLIVIGPGTYYESSLQLGGTASSGSLPVLLGDPQGALTGDAAGKVVIDSSGDGPTVTGPTLLDGLVLTGANTVGLRILRGRPGDVTIRNTAICGNAGDGLRISVDGVSAANDVVCDNGGRGISVRLRVPQRPIQLLNNTVTGNAGQGIVVREVGKPGSPGVLLSNNIVSGNAATRSTQ